MHLLFVCTGNTCRSPIAEFLTKTKTAALGLDWEIHSAGLFAIPGYRMSSGSQRALLRRKIEADGHESTPLTESLVRQADYIFTMTEAQRQGLVSKFQFSADKVFTIGAFAEDGIEGAHDVVDPFGSSDESYESCAAMLEKHIDSLIAKLMNN